MKKEKTIKEKIKAILSKYSIEMIQYADKDDQKLLKELVDLTKEAEEAVDLCKRHNQETIKKIIKELCDFRVNESEPWGTIRRLRKFLDKKL